MRVSSKIVLLCLSVAALLMTTACADEEFQFQGNGYGSMQMTLFKKGTRALTDGRELEYLREAKKIQLTMTYNNREIRQTLNLLAVNNEAAEFGLTSERLELMPGNYEVKSFVIFGEEVVNDQAEVLQEGEPDNATTFVIKANNMTSVAMPIEAIIRGSFSSVLEKDLSLITPAAYSKAKSGVRALAKAFNYEEVTKVIYELEYTVDGATNSLRFPMKAKMDKASGKIHTDTIALQEGDYKLNYFELYNTRNELILAGEKEVTFTIKHYTLTKEVVKVSVPKSDAIADYIALRKIWEALDGKNWSWNGTNHPMGANWLFVYEDGTTRPIDQWGKQPGVSLGPNGRVTQLNIGSFNPVGVVPDAIGDLTALEALYLGSHSETVGIDPDEGTEYTYDPYALAMKGIDIRANRLAIAKERCTYRSAQTRSDLYTKKKPSKVNYLTSYKGGPSEKSNRISGISERIGELGETLSVIYIANGLISKLPESFKNLTNLTDLEIYNSPFSEFPVQICELPSLVSLNLSLLPDMGNNASNFADGLDKFFKGPSAAKLQLLYMNRNNITSIPTSAQNMKNIRLFDFAQNRLKTVPPLGTDVAPIQVFLDANELTTIPTNFCRTDDMELFFAPENKITTFPAVLSNMKTGYSIEEINLSSNKISSFQHGFEGIRAEQINLINNLFKELPTQFSEFKSEIFFLRMSYNKIDTIKPAAIKNLKKLEALEIAGNNLRYMPKEFNSEYLPYFNAIDLDQNCFASFPYNILYVNTLGQLKIANQGTMRNGRFVRTLSEWPENIESHIGLNVLNISGNALRTVSNFPVNLFRLDITDNPNIKITVPSDIYAKMLSGMFVLYYDEDQDIQGINK